MAYIQMCIRVHQGISSAKCWLHPTIASYYGQIPMCIIMCPLDAESVIQSVAKLPLILSLPRSVTVIDNECRQVNDKLRRLVAVLPDASSLAPVDYDTSKRADPEVLQTLVSHAKKLKVYYKHSRYMCAHVKIPYCTDHVP